MSYANTNSKQFLSSCLSDPEQNKAAQFQSINDYWRRQNIHCKYKRIPGYQTSHLASESLSANCNASPYMGWKSIVELRISQTKQKLKEKKCSKGSPCLTFLWWIISSFGISWYIRWIWFCGWRQWWICGSPTYHHSWLASAPNVIEQWTRSGRTCMCPEMLLPVKLALAWWLGKPCPVVPEFVTSYHMEFAALQIKSVDFFSL